MKANLQQLLGLDKSNPLFEVYFDPATPQELLVHFGFRLLETVPANSFQEKLLLARLINAGYSQIRLHETFGYDIKTMKRWGLLLKSGTTEDIQKIADGRSVSKKLTDARLKMIFYLFETHNKEKGCHIISYIVKKYENIYHETISAETIRTAIKPLHEQLKEPAKYPVVLYTDGVKTRAMFAKLFAFAKTDIALEKVKITETTCRNKEILSSTEIEKAKCSPGFDISANNKFPLVEPVFKEIFSCHHIGLLLARIFIDFISSEMGTVKDIVRQWICMVLSGCQNIEQGQKLNYRALALLIGKQKTSPNRQRETLKDISDKINVRLLFKQNIKLVDAGLDDTFLLDPHGVGYTGQLKLLLCWLGGIHQTGKGYYLDLIHTLKGEPVFSKIDDNYFDLRQRFHAAIKDFRRILAGDKNRVLTIVVDRAIYDVNFMREARNEDVYIITWEKNFERGQWDYDSKQPVEHFVIQKYRNRKEDTYLYDIKFVKNRWHKEASFAQFIILLTKPGKKTVELSIICTDFNRDSKEAIMAILTRWLQENDMSYLISLGINCITSYSSFSYEKIAGKIVDREVKNKKLLKLMMKKNNLKNKLGRALLDREIYIEKKENDLIKLQNEFNKKETEFKNSPDNEKQKLKVTELKNKIKRLPKDRTKTLKNNHEKQLALREEISVLEQDIKPLAPTVSRLETLIEEEYIKLNFMPKSFMDGIKIISRNIIYQLLDLFRPIWNNLRNDHVILRELLACVGFINETEEHIYIQLNPARQFTNKEKQKILLFLLKISTLVNEKYDVKKMIIITLYDL